LMCRSMIDRAEGRSGDSAAFPFAAGAGLGAEGVCFGSGGVCFGGAAG